MSVQQQIQERTADATAAIALGSWTVTLSDVNIIIETATLSLGLVAAAFSVYFHVSRALRSRAQKRDQNDS